jgi:two-component system sensor histidine kinase ChvG
MARLLRRFRLLLAKQSRAVTRALSARFASSLTRRIVFLNLGGLVALAVGFLYVNQFREGLIDARVQSLQTQGEIIAAAISASASVDTDAITVDPEKLLQLAPGQSTKAPEESSPSLQFSINPERIGPVLRRLVMPTRTRARIFDRDGYLLLDSRSLSHRASVFRSDLQTHPSTTSEEASTLIERTWNAVRGRFALNDPPRGEEFAGRSGTNFPEVTEALKGETQNIVRVNSRGDTIISVAVPIQRLRQVQGALLLSTLGGDIDQIIASERWTIVRIFLVSAAIMFLLSLFLAGTIAEPIRRLAEAAYRVRRGIKSRQEIPDFTGRSDEIGHLSGALRDMTKALYNRIEAIERFAADVAHELKNPLTSLRSAVETLPIARTPNAQERLLAIIQHDVKRLDRLISDISDASRLDAELARADNQAVDLHQVLEAVVAVANGVGTNNVTVNLDVAPNLDEDGQPRTYTVMGYDSRLGQVFNNLIDNARSFSKPGGNVRVTIRAVAAMPKGGKSGERLDTPCYEIVVDDDGPGIPADAFERIFERFYTDRPDQGFGQNSGLGLSISRQIVEVHGGHIMAENRTAPAPVEGEPPEVLGARFTVWLPAACHGE